jgi:cholesterol transport system auxiliary component
MKFPPHFRTLTTGALCATLLLGGCSGLLPKPAPEPSFYALESVPLAAPEAPVVRSTEALTLIVSPPRAAAGYGSQRMLYVRQAHRLQYFSRSQWVDTPGRMLAPLLVARMTAGGDFSAVFSSASGAAADFRLDSEIVMLRQDFSTTPSHVRLLLRAYLIEDDHRRVIANGDFEAIVASASEDPYGGVIAANRAVQIVLDQLSAFTRRAIQQRHRSTPRPL